MTWCSRPEQGMQQDPSHSSDSSRQVLSDIAHAERVLLHHTEVHSTATGDIALVQHAHRFITYLQKHAQQSQGVLAIAKSDHSQAHPANPPSSISEAALNASAAALQTVFDSKLLSELCTILYSLYGRQACLDATPAPLTAPVHAVDHDRMAVPEDCRQAAGSVSLKTTSKSAQHQQHSALPYCFIAALESPQQHTHAHEQAPVDLRETAAIRCVYFPSYRPHLQYLSKALSEACDCEQTSR